MLFAILRLIVMRRGRASSHESNRDVLSLASRSELNRGEPERAEQHRDASAAESAQRRAKP